MKTCRYCQEEIKDGAKRCPHCQGDLRGFFGRHPIFSGCFSIIAILFILSAIVGNMALKSVKDSGNATSSATPTPAPTPIPDSDKQALASKYCENHNKTWRLPDLTSSGYPPINTKDEYSRELAHGSALTEADCLAVINALETKSGEDYDTIQKITERKYWTGMQPFEAALSIGYPDKINDSVGISGVQQQWVYNYVGSNTYLYFNGSDKDSLKLTSWQNF